MKMYLTHVDTPYRMLREDLPFTDDRLMLSYDDLPAFTSLRAVCALWCDHRLTDEEGWQENRHMRAHMKGQFPLRDPILSIEDARILGDLPLTRLSELWDDGVRIITPMWRGCNRLGGGYDTDEGLTAYGRNALCAAMERGMLPDISHASDRSAVEILRLAKGYRIPVLATHSNLRAVCPHPRNLTDPIAVGVAESGGMIGLSLVPAHVGGDEDVPSLLRHYRYAKTLGILDALCLGTDLDGTDTLISPLSHARDLILISDAMLCDGCSEEEIDAFCYTHAARLLDGRFPRALL